MPRRVSRVKQARARRGQAAMLQIRACNAQKWRSDMRYNRPTMHDRAQTDPTDDIIRQLFRLLPENLAQSRREVEKNLRAALNASLARMHLVTREEFDIQAELLRRTRAALDEIERRVENLEKEQKNHLQ